MSCNGIDGIERTWWRKGIENYEQHRMQKEVQSPVNDEMAISACEEKEGVDEVMGVCVAIVAMYSACR